ncbi:uDP-N-acetylenolpyruvoylglucosamine reductase [Phocaeicola coprophilus CAG:333]|jgi:UDP-N-acetylmuramate dehydrogenase|uniref:UDP-N-acetylenolpyruvoylglucosamine reductase n=1 Tax=Phocaeicola coprophilus DSM 18228 = JCM 13818 TaxID=547042 RepID=S0F9Z8_9BACT|nr:UDP-N-acetylmuramate dehydrogenase [Phocaeicola coprophilus]EEF77248.1 UDP-N-acetylmuramate dehydrogenase [Phocaeicola coprophilus DSM 18228 = JCM 13818]QRO25015.1 UDP-N-acetylmuramate dehydrogenase [Phocaeicola coprophilus]CDC54099.1 uDP-N-acetylenolpyruvoylglucosamine reductase [Phocaeicola coprophilus CAG:333]
MKELYNCSLLPYNTFGMDVKASRFVEYASVEELRGLWNAEREAVARALHIGGGSNLLFASDYEGLILHSAIKGYTVVKETEEEVEVRVGAGEVWDDFVAYTVANGWYGAENLSLIPGEVGASAVQNIGAYGVEAKDLIVSVDTFGLETGEERRFMREECRYAYRESVFKQELKGKYAVTFVTYRLKKHPVFHLEYGNIRAELEKQGCQVDLENVRRIIIAIRQAKLPDPKVLGNAGSFFMNPVVPKMQFEALLAQYPDMPHYPVDEAHVKIPAGWMIDRCGWKGKRVGHAGVHEKQALVLVNCGGATGKEVMHLAEEIVASVRERFGVTIRPEVNYIG